MWEGVRRSIWCNFWDILQVGLLGKVWHTIVHIFCILAKERSEVLQHLLGFLWLSVLNGVFSQFIVSSFMFNVCHSLLMLLKLNEWVNEVESIVYSALPLNLFSFTCFRLFGEDPCSPLPSSAPFHSYPSIHLIKSIKTSAYLAPTRILQKFGLIPGPKIVFPIFSTKNPKIKIKLSYLFTSLKSVFVISHLSPFEYFCRDRPEESPLLSS